jgi:Domain of unknown function (DUF222)
MESASVGFASAGGALEAITSGMRFLAELDAASMPGPVIADALRALERADAMEAVARGRLLWMFDTDRGYETEGYGGARSFIRFGTRVTKGQADAHAGLIRFRGLHAPFEQALLGGYLSLSVARRVGKLTGKIEDDADRTWADELIVVAAAAGVDEKDLMVIAAAAIEKLAPPDPDKPFKDRDLRLDLTYEGAGVLRGDLTPECAAMLGAVLARLAQRRGKEDTRSQGERNHDALQEALRRLLGADLLPKVNGHAVQAQVHIWLGDLIDLDDGSVLQQQWTARYAALWAAKRVQAAEGMGDGGAWISGPAARGVTCDAAMFPIVVGNPDLDAADELLRIAVELDGYLHGHDGDGDDDGAGDDDRAGDNDGEGADAASTGRIGAAVADPERAAMVIRLMEDLIGAAAAMMSGEPGLASFLRRGVLGPLGLGGPSLPLDVGDTDDVPWWIRAAVHARDGRCQAPTGCDQPAGACHQHHILPRSQHGHSSLENIGDYCDFHHLVWIHRWGVKIRKCGDGTWEAVTPEGKVFKTPGRSPPPRPG